MLWTTNKQTMVRGHRQMLQYHRCLIIVIAIIGSIIPTLAANLTNSTTINDNGSKLEPTTTTTTTTATLVNKTDHLIGNQQPRRLRKPCPIQGILDVRLDDCERPAPISTMPRRAKQVASTLKVNYSNIITNETLVAEFLDLMEKSMKNYSIYGPESFFEDHNKTKPITNLSSIVSTPSTIIKSPEVKAKASKREIIRRPDQFVNWPELFRAELKYYKNLGPNPEKSPLKPRWAVPCSYDYDLSRFKRQHNNSTDKSRKQRSIGKHYRKVKLNYDGKKANHIGDVDSSFLALTNKGSNGISKKRKIKYLHQSDLEPMIETTGKISPDANVTQEELHKARNQLKGVLGALFLKLRNTEGLARSVADRLLGEYFPNKEQILNRTRNDRLKWLPEVDALDNAERVYKNTREKINITMEYLQYFAVGFEQAIANQLEWKESQLMDLFHVEGTVVDFICLVSEAARLNKMHFNQYYRIFALRKQSIIKSGQVSNDNHNTSDDDRQLSLMLKSDDTIDQAPVDNKSIESYISRSVMNDGQRHVNKRIHRYLRDYLLIRDYVKFLSFLRATMAELTDNFLRIDKVNFQD